MLRATSPDEMRQIEAAAAASGISAEALMEQAGKATASFISSYAPEKKAVVIAGTGNNGGDGYVVARYLLQDGFFVQVVQVGTLDATSLTKKQRRRYEARGGKVVDLDHQKLTLPQEGVLIDALFGTGFHGRQKQHTIDIIEAINSSKLPIIAVDVPSGLNAADGTVQDVAVKAHVTCTMEFPKIGFFFADGWNHVGKVVSLPIGLKDAANTIPCSLYVLENHDAKSRLPPIVRTRNKYSRGHVVGLAGSHGMAGAALMASFSSLKAGAGIVHLLHPEAHAAEFNGPPLEVVRIGYLDNDIECIKNWLQKADALFIGPGLGRDPKQAAMLAALLPSCTGKMVLDADALYWLAQTKGTKFGPLSQAILTPHFGELERFFPEKEPLTPQFIKKCQLLVDENKTNLILKGGPTFLFSHGEVPTVLMEGDPGMATAGSGDVLTGVLAAMLAQGLTPRDAMLTGAYIHGRAGELAAAKETSYSVTATSLITELPQAIKEALQLP